MGERDKALAFITQAVNLGWRDTAPTAGSSPDSVGSRL